MNDEIRLSIVKRAKYAGKHDILWITFNLLTIIGCIIEFKVYHDWGKIKLSVSDPHQFVTLNFFYPSTHTQPFPGSGVLRMPKRTFLYLLKQVGINNPSKDETVLFS